MKDATLSNFPARYGPWAVVAGASEGLGAEFATELAERGLNLVLAARRAERLEALAAHLRAAHAVQVHSLPLDLSRPEASLTVQEQTRDLEIGLLVYNAAFAAIGPFFQRSPEEHLRELDLNCRTPLELVYLLGRQFLAQHRGGIVLMSSLSASQGAALISHYAATKAYNLVLAEGLWAELRKQGVDVLACCAGATNTPNYIASLSRASVRVQGSAMQPRAVVAETLAALGKQPSVIPGRQNRLAAFVLRRLLPRKVTIQLMARVLEGMYG